jgi:hypothetical protein
LKEKLNYSMKQTEQNTCSDEYFLLSVRDWEIDCGKEFTEDSYAANTQHDQQADRSFESNS